MSKLILTADDYGLNPSINEAVIESVKNGTVTSVQVLANYASEEDIRYLAKTIDEAGNRCGIGLHFCTTAGPSLLQQSSTLTQGEKHTFYDITEWNYEQTNSHDMLVELTKQFVKLRDIIGVERIDSFSSHHNIHLFSDIYMKIIVHLAEANWIPIRSPLRWTQDKGTKTYPDGVGLAPIEKASVHTLFSCKSESTQKILFKALDKDFMRSNRSLANDNKKTGGTPDSTSGHWYGQPSKRAIDWTVQELMNLRDDEKPYYATEIFMHLANSTIYEDPLLTYSMRDRVIEYTTLNSQEVKDFIQSLYSKPDFELGSYRKVLLGETVNYKL